MAKRVIGEQYTFTPATKTVVINGKTIQRERLILILNVTQNIVLYNFSDSALTAQTYTISTAANVETTTIVLNYNTTLMNANDKLSIIVDEVDETFTPAESVTDPVGKIRMSTPQALIDTDFEYGVQSTKWETLALTNQRQSSFYDSTTGIAGIPNVVTVGGTTGTYSITNITGNGTRLVTVTMANTTNITTGTPIYIQDSTDSNANGWYIPDTITGGTSFTYYARANVTNGTIFDPYKTYLFVGSWYTGSSIPVGTSAYSIISSGATSVIQVTTTNNHGLAAGQAIYVTNVTGASTKNPVGSWTVRRTLSSHIFDFEVPFIVGTGPLSNASNQSLYPRTWGTSIHRAFDGGVTFTAGYPYQGNQLIRQTRRYFRYQSGKGIQFSTGSNLCSPFQVDSLTASGTTVTVTTKFPHNLWIGSFVRVSGADQTAYNTNSAQVTSVPSDTTFTYVVGSVPSPATATSSGGYNVSPVTWYGASLRIGMFDHQNGFFFEYDGQNIFACRRSSTNQLVGYINSLANGGQYVQGTNSKWSETLIPGDMIVIRGMSYEVVSVESNTSMTIYPDYRGPTISAPQQVIVSKTVDTKIPQTAWNIDRMDGSGVSSYTVDITKMQMWYIDYSWYGAGAIRWGFKDQRGAVRYCHRLAHANNQSEAYMRSGNLPARYEVNTLYPKTVAINTITSGEVSTISVRDNSQFPGTGTIVVSAPGNIGANIEYINYGSKGNNTFGNLTRAVQGLPGPGGLTNLGGTGTAATFSYSSTSCIGIAYWGPQAACTISHWGSSVIMDGRYDDDKSFLFNYGLQSPVTYTNAGQRYPVFSIRLAPSVDSGLVGQLGQREIINRMQLTPAGAGVYPTGAGVKVEIWLNARTSVGTWTPIGGSSLAQFATHGASGTITGGECIYTFFAPSGGVSTQDISKVRDIGNSILGGGTTSTISSTSTNMYPDGPDVITIAVTPLASNAATVARLSWTEAQA